MKKSVLTLIAVLALSASTANAQQGRRDNNAGYRIENSNRAGNHNHGSQYSKNYINRGNCGGYIDCRSGRRGDRCGVAPVRVVTPCRRYARCAPAPVVVAPAPVVYHRPVRVCRPAPVCVAPAPVVYQSSGVAAGVVAGAVVGTVIGALLCN